jgi:hypothetical protein
LRNASSTIRVKWRSKPGPQKIDFRLTTPP